MTSESIFLFTKTEQKQLIYCIYCFREALNTLEESIAFASKILHIDTTNVEPLYAVHQDQYLELRDDEVTEGNIAKELLNNSPLIEEEYFVSPPGNVELEAEEKDF